MALRWDDADEIGCQLCRKHGPALDPLSVRFTDLAKMVAALEEFQDDPRASTEGRLEAIQMAWLEHYQK